MCVLFFIRSNETKSFPGTMYLVCESALLLVFSMCVMCKKTTTTIQKKVIGTFVHITQ